MSTRRTFLKQTGTTAGLLLWSQNAAADDRRYGVRNSPAEWPYTSAKRYSDPFNDIELDVIFQAPSGAEHLMPAFWAGENVWRVRYAPSETGEYTYRTVATDATNADLHNREGRLSVEPYTGRNPLYQHGPLRVAADRRHLEHTDGTPFFWLGDTWWMSLCKRLPLARWIPNPHGGPRPERVHGGADRGRPVPRHGAL